MEASFECGIQSQSVATIKHAVEFTFGELSLFVLVLRWNWEVLYPYFDNSPNKAKTKNADRSLDAVEIPVIWMENLLLLASITEVMTSSLVKEMSL